MLNSRIGSRIPQVYVHLLLLMIITVLSTHYLFCTSSANISKSCPALDPNSVIVPVEQLMKSPFTFEQDDPRLIQEIRSKYVYPPSNEPYDISVRNARDPSNGRAKAVSQLLHEKKGFFVECGGLDGVLRSNTLYLERILGWKGVLIEADPKNFERLRMKNRKAWAVNACLGIHPYPNSVIFKQNFNTGQITNMEKGIPLKNNHIEVQCFPFYSILLALNVTSVDFFSIDVEGSELKILKTIPWKKVDIKIIAIEYIHDEEGKDAVMKYITSTGYTLAKEFGRDLIFIKKELMPIE